MKNFIVTVCLILTASMTWAMDVARDPQGLIISIAVPPGGPLDQYARHLQKHLQPLMAGPVMVEYVPGAGGVIGTNQFVNSYSAKRTKILFTNDQILVNKYLSKKLEFDLEARVTPVALLGRQPYVVAVNTRSGIKRFQDLQKNKNANLALPGAGSFIHYVAILMENQIGIQFNHIQYQGTAKILPDLVSNQTQVTVLYPNSLMSFVRRGELEILAVSGDRRLADLPNVPTFAELGVNMPRGTFWAVFANQELPDERQQELTQLINKALATAESQQALKDMGIDTTQERNLKAWWQGKVRHYQDVANRREFGVMNQ